MDNTRATGLRRSFLQSLSRNSDLTVNVKSTSSALMRGSLRAVRVRRAGVVAPHLLTIHTILERVHPRVRRRVVRFCARASSTLPIDTAHSVFTVHTRAHPACAADDDRALPAGGCRATGARGAKRPFMDRAVCRRPRACAREASRCNQVTLSGICGDGQYGGLPMPPNRCQRRTCDLAAAHRRVMRVPL